MYTQKRYKILKVHVKNKIARIPLFYTIGNNMTPHKSIFAEYLDSFGITGIINTWTCVLFSYQCVSCQIIACVGFKNIFQCSWDEPREQTENNIWTAGRSTEVRWVWNSWGRVLPNPSAVGGMSHWHQRLGGNRGHSWERWQGKELWFVKYHRCCRHLHIHSILICITTWGRYYFYFYRWGHRKVMALI